MFELEIGGRKSDRVPSSVALRDVSLDSPPVTEQTRGFIGIARPERGPDVGRGDLHAPAGEYRRKHGRAEAFHVAHVSKDRGIAAASLAEAKILADHDMGDAEFP